MSREGDKCWCILWEPVGTRAVFLPSEHQKPGYSFLTPRAHLGRNPPEEHLSVCRVITALGGGKGVPKVHRQKPPLRQLCVCLGSEGHSQQPLLPWTPERLWAKFTWDFPTTPQCLKFNNRLHSHNNKLKIKHFGAP